VNWDTIFSVSIEAAIGTNAVIYALAAIGINVQFGYTGLLNFGQAAFMAVGAYGLAIGVATWGLNFWLSVGIGLAAAVALAVILGVPTLRLRADYLAIVTIAAAEIFRLTVRTSNYRDITGGTDGLQQFSGAFFDINPYGQGDYGIGPVSFDERTMWVLTIGWILVALCCLIVYLLMRSPWGRVLKAIREDEDAVRSLGKNVFAYKMQSLILGGVIGALAGFIFALSTGSVLPDSYAPEVTFFAYTIVILGGAARVLGPVVGAVIFWLFIQFSDQILRQAISAGYIPDSFMDTTQVGAVRFILVGLGLMLLIIFRPQGIFGDKREIALDAR
jgi:branched-chain amino acid transport system permease protein